MSQINPGTNAMTTGSAAFASTRKGEFQNEAQNSYGAQLSKLSSVLNGLENGASVMRRHAMQAMGAVRSGTYTVDAVQLSRRIVGEALGSA